MTASLSASSAPKNPPPRQRLSLAGRVLIGAALWGVAVLVGGAFLLSAVYRAQAERLLDEDLSDSLKTLSRAINLSESLIITSEEREDYLPQDPKYSVPLSGKYWASGHISQNSELLNTIRSASLWDSDFPISEELVQKAQATPGATFYENTIGPADEPLRIAGKSILMGENNAQILFLSGEDRTSLDQGAQQFLNLVIGAMLALFAGVFAAMLLQIKLSLAPLHRLERDVSEIRAGTRERLANDYPSEVVTLTEELNKLLSHNRQVVERARMHVGNLAHALKTPIAVLRNEANGDTLLDDVVRRQSESMHNNVQHYLKRAQAAARAETLGARCEMRPVIDGLARLLNRLFEEKGIAVSSFIPNGAVFKGEQQDLEEMVGNLMENACKWAKSTVSVTIEPAQTAGFKLLHVDDDGPGLTPEERESAVQRGVRLDETAPGTGLGLSIVNELAELYGGRFSLEKSPKNGLRATLTLPTL